MLPAARQARAAVSIPTQYTASAGQKLILPPPTSDGFCLLSGMSGPGRAYAAASDVSGHDSSMPNVDALLDGSNRALSSQVGIRPPMTVTR